MIFNLYTKGKTAMVKIAVCDDEESATSDIEGRLKMLSEKSGIAADIDVFFDGRTLMDYLINQKAGYDIIYIDIELKSENGVETARKIRQHDKNVLLIFVTNYESFAKEAFEVSAFRFITKPIEGEIFEKYFINALEAVRQTPHFFQFQYNKVHYRLAISQIIYFQSDRRVTYINIGTETPKCYETLNSIEQNLKQRGIYFFRTHQSFLVNPKYVEIYTYDTIQLQDGTVLAISEKRRKAVSELYCQIKGDAIIV